MKRNKLIIGFLTLAVGALIGSTNVVGAIGTNQMAANPPATKADCKNGGWRNHTDENGRRFRNQGQCIAWVNAHGYGGGTINIGIGTNINGNNNVVTNVINFFFGRGSNNANVNVGVNTNVRGNNNVVANVINLIFANGARPANINVAANTNVQGNNNIVSNFIRFCFT